MPTKVDFYGHASCDVLKGVNNTIEISPAKIPRIFLQLSLQQLQQRNSLKSFANVFLLFLSLLSALTLDRSLSDKHTAVVFCRWAR